MGSSPDGRLQVMFCNPREEQYFQLLPDGRLVLGSMGSNGGGIEGRCVQLGMGKTRLVLGDCSSAIRLDLVNGSYLQLQKDSKVYQHLYTQGKEERCISPITKSNEGLVPNLSPANRDPVSLSSCHEEASRITLIEENYFQESMKYLLLPFPKAETNCDFPACGINKVAVPVALQPTGTVERCHDVSQCVTVVTNTARRPEMVLRMIQSIRKFEKYRNLSVIAYDGGVGEFSDEIMEEILSCPNLKYIIGEEEEMGIAQGLKHVNTKYLLLLDDDNMFTEKTNLELLAEILDTTDASLVGGTDSLYKGDTGFINFGYLTRNERRTRRLFVSPETCEEVNETIPNFPTCVRCELTSNYFLVRTRDIGEVGGWSKDLTDLEHKDLFIRLKAADKKVVYCPEVIISNDKPGKRMKSKTEDRMTKLFGSRWNIDDINR